MVQTQTIAQPHRHRDTRATAPKNTHTHTRTLRQNHRARTHKVRALGLLHRQSEGHVGRGPLLTSPRHRHTNSTQTGRCPQPDSQPATQTNELHGKDACAPQTTGRGDQGTSTRPHRLIPVQPEPCLPHHPPTLWSCPPGLGTREWAGRRRERGRGTGPALSLLQEQGGRY